MGFLNGTVNLNEMFQNLQGAGNKGYGSTQGYQGAITPVQGVGQGSGLGGSISIGPENRQGVVNSADNRFGQALLAKGVNTPGKVTNKDLGAAMMLDRASLGQAQLQQRLQEEKGRTMMQGAYAKTQANMRQEAQQAPARNEQAVAPFAQEAQNLYDQQINSINQRTAQVTERINQMTQQALDAKNEELASLDGGISASLEEVQRGIAQNEEQAKADVLREAQAAGFSPDDPYVLAQLQQVEGTARMQRADLHRQTKLSYEQTRSELLRATNSMIQGAQQAAVQGELAGSGQALSAEAQAISQKMAAEELVFQSRVAAEKTRALLNQQADEWERQGAENVAAWMRDETIAVSPLAPLLASLMALEDSSPSSGSSLGNSGINFGGTLDMTKALGGGIKKSSGMSGSSSPSAQLAAARSATPSGGSSTAQAKPAQATQDWSASAQIARQKAADASRPTNSNLSQSQYDDLLRRQNIQDWMNQQRLLETQALGGSAFA